MNDIEREAIMCELESEFICEPLSQFIDAMREDINATNEEIRARVVKEITYYLRS